MGIDLSDRVDLVGERIEAESRTWAKLLSFSSRNAKPISVGPNGFTSHIAILGLSALLPSDAAPAATGNRKSPDRLVSAASKSSLLFVRRGCASANSSRSRL